MKTQTLLFTLLLLLSTITINAQHLDVGISFGNASYIGDLITPRNGSAFKQINPSFSTFARWNTKKVNFRAGILFTELEGDDRDGLYPERAFNFRTPLLEASFIIEYNIVDIKFNYGNSYTTIYAFGGMAGFQFNPQALYEGRWVDLQPLGTEGQGLKNYEARYDLRQIAIPFGAGVNVKIDKQIAIKFEVGVRKLFTDYLDDVSGREVNYLDLMEGNGTTAATLSVPSNIKPQDSFDHTYVRGNQGLDMYFLYEVSFAYTFGEDEKLRYPFR